MWRRLGAEFFGTFWLTFAGCGSAVLAVALVEGRYPLPRAKVVTSDFSATPNPLIAHKTKNLLSPI